MTDTTNHCPLCAKYAKERDQARELNQILVDDLSWGCECSEGYRSRNLIAPNCEWCRYDEKTKAAIEERRALLDEMEGL